MQEDEETLSLRPLGGGPAGARRAVAATEPVREPSAGFPLHSGEVLGRYFILDELGRGGMGVVYVAYDPELDRKIALKLLHPGRSGQNIGQARLLREAQALARLSHPNVIHVYDAGVAGIAGDRVFMAMELVDGETLDTWLEREARPWRQVLAVFQAAGRGLAAAHAAGLVHRDFKPGNVLLGRDGRVRVLDFGIARSAGTEVDEGAEPLEAREGRRGVRLTTPLTRVGVVVGTPRFMAPEALRGGRIDARADQFSFCVTLHEALYGISPYTGSEPLDLLAEATAGRVCEAPAGSRVPAWVRRIVLRGLSPDPAQRYPSMGGLLADLGRDRATPLRRWAGVAAVVLLGSAGAFAWYRAEQRQARICAGAEEKLAGIWDGDRKAVLRRAFLGSGRPYAADAWSGVERALDTYTHAWAALRTEACEATRVRSEQSPELLDLRMQCLDRRLQEVRALTALFASGEAGVVERAMQASRGLPGLDECADATALTAPIRPPASPAVHRTLDALHNRIAEAHTLWTTGRYTDGLPVAASAAEAAAKLGYPPVEAEVLQIRALLEDSANHFETAETTLFQALAAAERGRHDALAARAWIDLVWVTGYREHKFVEAKRWARQAEASLARLGGAGSYPEMDADLRSNLGGVLDAEGDHEQGLALQQQALALYEKTLGADHPNVGRTLNRIGNVYYQAKRFPQALDAYRQALEQSRRSLGPRHPTVAVRLGNIALVLDALGRFDESLALQLEALGIEEKALDPTHPRLSLTHGNLAALLITMGRPQAALEQARRGIAIDEANPDTAPEDLGASLLNEADALLHLARYAEALATVERARALLLGSVGDHHPWTALAESTRGQILRAQDRPAEAIAALRQSLADYRAAGEESPEVAWTRFMLACALWDLGDHAQARGLARQARQELTGGTRPANLRAIDAWLAGRR